MHPCITRPLLRCPDLLTALMYPGTTAEDGLLPYIPEIILEKEQDHIPTDDEPESENSVKQELMPRL